MKYQDPDNKYIDTDKNPIDDLTIEELLVVLSEFPPDTRIGDILHAGESGDIWLW